MISRETKSQMKLLRATLTQFQNELKSFTFKNSEYHRISYIKSRIENICERITYAFEEIQQVENKFEEEQLDRNNTGLEDDE